MTTPEPPEGPTHPRPGPDGEAVPASGADDARTEEIHAPGHSAGDTPAGDTPAGEAATEHRAEPAPAASAASTSSPAADGTGRSRWRLRRPRRRWPVVTGAVIVGLLVLGLVFGLGALAGAHHARHDRFAQAGQAGQGGGMGHGRMHGMGGGHHGMGGHRHGGMGDGPGGPGGPGAMGGMGGGRMGSGGMGGDMGGDMGGGGMGPGGGQAQGGPGRSGRGAEAAPAVTGSLVTINGANMVITPDGAPQVTVAVSPQTRVFGPQRASLTDLKAGDRVAVREDANHQVVGVIVVPARAVGTITAVNGNQATLVRPDGLTEPLDLTAVTTKPAVGDHVMVEGTSTANGATLAASQLQQLPKVS